jgi:hypothetical protein
MRLKIKTKVELTFGDLVNPLTISINENCHSVAATNVPAVVLAGTTVRVQTVKDLKEKNEFRRT